MKRIILSAFLVGCGGPSLKAGTSSSSTVASSASSSASSSSSSGTGAGGAPSSSASSTAASSGTGAAGSSSSTAASSSSGAPNPCPATTPTILANGQGIQSDVVSDGSEVFWLANQGITKVSACGGPSTTFAQGLVGTPPYRLAVDNANLYWTSADGLLWIVAKGGGTPAILAHGSPVTGTLGLTLDGTHVYWNTGGNTIAKLPIGGGLSTNVVMTTPRGIIANDSGSLYWPGVTGPSNGVWKADKGGGAISGVEVSADDVSTNYVTVDAANVYWTQAYIAGDAFRVMKAPKGGGAPVIIADYPGGAQMPGGVASDGASVYWAVASSTNGGVFRAPVGGGAPVQLATGNVGPIALDAWNVYWSDSDNGNISKVSK